MKQIGKLTAALLINALLIVMLWAAGSSPALADNHGQTLLSGGSWMNGRGVDVKSNGSRTGSGYDWGASYCKRPDGANVYCGQQWQCVELPQRLYISRGWYPSAFPVGAAYQIYDKAAAGALKNCAAYRNGSGYIPIPGDMIISSIGAYGHVSVVDTVDTAHNVVNAVEQNVSSTNARAAYKLLGSTLSRAGFPIKGVVHCIMNSPVPDGLYRASNETSVFMVTGGVRRAIPSGECFNDWGLNWNSVKVIDSATLYNKTQWQQPIAHLVKSKFSPTVYWITESVNSSGINHIIRPTGQYVARPISSAAVFDGMHFNWGDIRTVNYNITQAYPVGPMLINVEPRLVVTDGPYCIFANNSFGAGWRVRNLSDANHVGLSATIRACQMNQDGSLNGNRIDFPWSGIGGLDKIYSDGWSPAWRWIPNYSMPRGKFFMKVIYSYWGNYQYAAPRDGEHPYPQCPFPGGQDVIGVY